MLSAVTVALHVHVDSECLVQTGRAEIEHKIALVDAVSVLQCHFESNLVTNFDVIADIGVLHFETEKR